MSSYLVLQDRIADEVRPGSASAAASGIEAIIQREILSAIKHYERERFYFNTRITDTFALVVDQEYYGSAALAAIPNLIAIDDMYVTLDSVRYHVTPAPFDEIAAAQTGSAKSDPPYRYAIYAQQIRFYPIPSAVRTVTMADHYRLTTLSAGSDSNAWTTDAEELIRNRAESVIWARILREVEQAAVSKTAEMEALAILHRETRKRRNMRVLQMPPELRGAPVYDIRTG